MPNPCKSVSSLRVVFIILIITVSLTFFAFSSLYLHIQDKNGEHIDISHHPLLIPHPDTQQANSDAQDDTSNVYQTQQISNTHSEKSLMLNIKYPSIETKMGKQIDVSSSSSSSFVKPDRNSDDISRNDFGWDPISVSIKGLSHLQISRVIKMVKHPGVLPQSYRSNMDINNIKHSLDLPRIYQIDVQSFFDKEMMNKRIKVCFFNITPRQRSLFSTNTISMFATGVFNYVSLEATECQYRGKCESIEEAQYHPQCDPTKDAMIIFNERHKELLHERFHRVLIRAKEYYDVVIVSGDEYCRAGRAYGKTDYRMYYSPNMISQNTLPDVDDLLKDYSHKEQGSKSLASIKNIPWWERATNTEMSETPLYMPLGVREELGHILPREILLVSQRKYLFNFIGSLTSPTREGLKDTLSNIHIPNTEVLYHFAQNWTKVIKEETGHILPNKYRQVLLNSTFTLCPDGHNPEAFRLYEACAAGSIPIVALGKVYQEHSCHHGLLPLIKAGAPFVLLNDWDELQPFLAKVYKNRELLQRMQVNVMEWYSKYMKTIAKEFEDRLLMRYNERMKRLDNDLNRENKK